MSAGSIQATREGRAGLLVLDRPKALNALDLGMIRGLARALAAWEGDPAIAFALIEGAGGRAFCAGGDVRAVRAMHIAGDHAGAEEFFVEEYALNLQIARFPKPFVALIDGICMGGGLGVSVHGSHRIVTEHAMLAMPETMIGLFPDIGGSHFLSRAPGRLGLYAALTGARMDAGDALALGLATHFVPRARLAALRAAILAADGRAALDAAIAAHAEAPPPSVLAGRRAVIDRLLAADEVPAIIAALEADAGAVAQETLATLRAVSPTSVHVTVELLRRGRTFDLAACLAMELRLVSNATAAHDFLEGVRAQVVDKDRQPRWQPARLEDVRPEAVRALFGD